MKLDIFNQRRMLIKDQKNNFHVLSSQQRRLQSAGWCLVAKCENRLGTRVSWSEPDTGRVYSEKTALSKLRNEGAPAIAIGSHVTIDSKESLFHKQWGIVQNVRASGYYVAIANSRTEEIAFKFRDLRIDKRATEIRRAVADWNRRYPGQTAVIYAAEHKPILRRGLTLNEAFVQENPIVSAKIRLDGQGEPIDLHLIRPLIDGNLG
jgi:hypothetical protein